MAIDLETRAERLGRTEEEIRAEIAASLGRTAERLEGLLAEIEALRARADGLAGAERAAIVERHNELCGAAERWRWYLVVQREAIGLTRHEDVERMYPIPTVLRP